MRSRVMAVGAVALLVVAGCGPKGAPVEGNVVNGGKAYSPATDGDVNIKLTAVSGGKTYTGKAEPDGSFKIVATDGSGGVIPGKYKVGFTKYPKMPEGKTPTNPPMPTTKELAEEWDVVAGQKYTLDIAKGK